MGVVSMAGSFLFVATEVVRLRDSAAGGTKSVPSGFLRATGHDRPRSLPLLATPTPQVSVVL